MKKLYAGLLMLLLLSAGWRKPVSGDQVEETVQKVLKAYGGASNLKGVRVFRETGVLTSTMRKGKEGKFVRTFKRPDFLMVRISFPGEEVEERVLRGLRGSRQGKVVSGPPLDAMILQAARLELPWILTRKRADVNIVKESGDQKGFAVLKVDLGSGMALYAYVDTSDWLIKRSRGIVPMKRGNVEFETDYEDFRPIRGVLFPFRETNYVSGMKTADSVIEQIEVLHAVPER